MQVAHHNPSGENLTDAHRSSQIQVSIQEDCSVVVSKVAFSPDRLEDPIDDEDDDDADDGEEVAPRDAKYPGLAGAWGVGASSQEYRGGAASALHEPLDIAVTRTTAGMDYYDYGSSVGGGHNRRNRCRAFITFWYIEECTYTWWPNGSSSVYSQTRGEFDNFVIPNSEHWQQSKFEAWAGNWGYECEHEGDPPWPLNWVCYADRYPLP